MVGEAVEFGDLRWNSENSNGDNAPSSLQILMNGGQSVAEAMTSTATNIIRIELIMSIPTRRLSSSVMYSSSQFPGKLSIRQEMK